MLMNYNDFCKNHLNVNVDDEDIGYVSELVSIVKTMKNSEDVQELCKLLSKSQLGKLREIIEKYQGLKADNMANTKKMDKAISIMSNCI